MKPDSKEIKRLRYYKQEFGVCGENPFEEGMWITTNKLPNGRLKQQKFGTQKVRIIHGDCAKRHELLYSNNMDLNWKTNIDGSITYSDGKKEHTVECPGSFPGMIPPKPPPNKPTNILEWIVLIGVPALLFFGIKRILNMYK